MAVKIYDTSMGAFKDEPIPQIYDASAQAYKDSTGLVYDQSKGAWDERWEDNKIYLYKNGIGTRGFLNVHWVYDYKDSTYHTKNGCNSYGKAICIDVTKYNVLNVKCNTMNFAFLSASKNLPQTQNDFVYSVNTNILDISKLEGMHYIFVGQAQWAYTENGSEKISVTDYDNYFRTTYTIKAINRNTTVDFYEVWLEK